MCPDAFRSISFRTTEENSSSRPDCAYFLLLGLCGAAFLLTIGGILTYIAFNPGAIDGHPHAALSHIPHFHHHNNPHHQYPQQQHHLQQGNNHQAHSQHTSAHNNHTNNEKQQHNGTFPSPITPGGNHSLHSPPNSPVTHHELPPNHHQQHYQHGSHYPLHPNNSTAAAILQSAYDAKTRQSLILAIIGPLCLLMGIIATLIVGVLALKFDCDKEPEPNISFLRLRSEMSLNYDPADKNNLELCRPSSTVQQDLGGGGVHPTEFA